MGTSLVMLSDVHAGYGRSEVLFGIDLRIEAGTIVTLLGRNGMGKSTTVKTLLGAVRPFAGQVEFDGKSIAAMAPDAIARLGIAVVPEGRRIFPNLTVHEHLVAFARQGGGMACWAPERLYGMFPRLKERSRHWGHQLSGGEQQMLAIARALSTHPRLLILDEATEGLAPVIRDEIWDAIRVLRGDGQTILLIDKHIDRMAAITDRHVVIERGRVVWAGTSEEMFQEADLVERYLGVGGAPRDSTRPAC